MISDDQLNENFLPESILVKLIYLIENRGNKGEIYNSQSNAMMLFYDKIKRKYAAYETIID